MQKRAADIASTTLKSHTYLHQLSIVSHSPFPISHSFLPISLPLSSVLMNMYALVIALVFMLAMIRGSDAAWCVCQSGGDLQKTLDYACGAGADCNPIIQSGACYNPNTVLAHCSYAVNSYYQRNGQAQDACDFAGTAILTTTDPSLDGCSYPDSDGAILPRHWSTGSVFIIILFFALLVLGLIWWSAGHVYI